MRVEPNRPTVEEIKYKDIALTLDVPIGTVMSTAIDNSLFGGEEISFSPPFHSYHLHAEVPV